MDLTRRQFVAGVGGAGLVYVLGGCSRSAEELVEMEPRIVPRPHIPGIDFREWILISADGKVSVFTSRNELGQGLTTVIYDLVCQGLELPRERVEVVLGDTDSCPNDGPTTGSAATRYVAWAFWEACHEIRGDLVHLAAEHLECSPEELVYRQGEVVGRTDTGRRVGIGELAQQGQVRRVGAGNGAGTSTAEAKTYEDRGNLNVNGEAIVTGTLRYTGDYHPVGCLYGGLLLPRFHRNKTRLKKFDATEARRLPGVLAVEKELNTVVALGTSFTAVQSALDAVQATWKVPNRPQALDNEREIRSGAKLIKVVEESGKFAKGLESSDLVVEESYITQYGSQVPIETKTAIAEYGPELTVIRTGGQSPFRVQHGVAEKLEVPTERVRVVSVPAGGAFGSRTSGKLGARAAVLSRMAGAPVKLVYSRKFEFQSGARYKESVLVDIETGVARDGKILARKIDIHQDEGYGTVGVYDIPHVSTKLYHARMPTRHATMRGTSYTQSVFAVESHTDSVAHAVGMDPVEFRRLNALHDAFHPLLDACAEMIGHGRNLPPDRGVGLAMCKHGGSQLGVIGAEVSVHRESGRVTVEKLCGAFDIGTVINRHTTRMGVQGAMIWGLGYAMSEEVVIDGHRCYTESLADYRIPRFSDIPPIEIEFFENYDPGRPAGCGEMPLVPTPPAICNAVYNAIGIRFHTLPLTPERVKAALARA